MEVKQIITATVAVILVCLVAIPIIDASTADINTAEQNTGMRYTNNAGISGEMAITNGEKFVKVGDYTINTSTSGIPTILFLSDSVAITAGGSADWPAVKIVDLKNNIAFNNGVSSNLTISESSVKYSNNNVNYEVPFTWCYVLSENGTYGQWWEYGGASAKNVYFDKGQDILMLKAAAASTTTGTTHMVLAKFDGSGSTILTSNTVTYPDSGTTATVTTLASSDYTLQNPTVTDTDLGYMISDYDARVIIGETTYFMVILAPIEYHILTENQSIVLSLINIVPVLLIAAILIGIGYSIMGRNN